MIDDQRRRFGRPRNFQDEIAYMLGLVPRQAATRLVKHDDARATDKAARDVDQPVFKGVQAARQCMRARQGH